MKIRYLLIFAVFFFSSSQAFQFYANFSVGPLASFGTDREANFKPLYNPTLMTSQYSGTYGVGIRPATLGTFLGNFRLEANSGYQQMWFDKYSAPDYEDPDIAEEPYGSINIKQNLIFGVYYDFAYFGDFIIPYVGVAAGSGTLTFKGYDTTTITYDPTNQGLEGSGDHITGSGSSTITQAVAGITLHLPNTPGEAYFEVKYTDASSVSTTNVLGDTANVGVKTLGWNIGFRLYFIGGGGILN